MRRELLSRLSGRERARTSEREEQRLLLMARLRIVEVEASKLLQSPGWPQFQRMLAGMREETLEQIAPLESRLADPSVYLPPDQVARLRFDLSVLRSRVATLEDVLKVPEMLAKKPGEPDAASGKPRAPAHRKKPTRKVGKRGGLTRAQSRE